MADAILEVDELKTYFFLRRGVVKAVDGVSFAVRQGEVLGLVGESGCGKSVTCLSILRLVPPPGRIVAGRIVLDGEEILSKGKQDMQRLRGRKVSLIMQDPASSLNPVFTIGDQIAEAVTVKHRLGKADLWYRVTELLRLLNFPAPEKRLRDYPHQLSGGMKQRVAGSIALAAMPPLLIADEPTTALDVTIQAQYLQELKRLRDQFTLSIIFVTHDFGIVAGVCDRVCVMYAGKVVEHGPVADLLSHPLHPYTAGLLSSRPRLDTRLDKLPMIPGEPPALLNLPPGCSYFPRCSASRPQCAVESPPLTQVSTNHTVRCWYCG